MTHATTKPDDRRPYRAQHEPGHQQTVIRTEPDGTRVRLVLRQVGWHGQSGAFYALDESPELYEPGSYQPLLIVVDSERLPEIHVHIHEPNPSRVVVVGDPRMRA